MKYLYTKDDQSQETPAKVVFFFYEEFKRVFSLINYVQHLVQCNEGTVF